MPGPTMGEHTVKLGLGSLMVALLAFAGGPVSAAPFVFQPGDHVALIGNALPDRMQHDGWLEAMLQSANPDKQLYIRNMAFSGDEVNKRPREENFTPVDDYLTFVGATVIFAFFGYNEAYQHDPEQFKQDLRTFLDETAQKKYDGKAAPRVVLFSPIAFENLGSPNFPDGKEHNLWLSIYTDAMARVAQEKNVPFVDLFAPSLALYASTEAPLTVNGAHLSADGNKAIAQVIADALGQTVNSDHLEAVRTAVLDKNWCWFNRYRATDGNDVWGNRSTLTFVDKQTNAEVLQHELVMLDVKTANRDKVIWAAAQGKSIQPDDSNVPDPVLVKTNLPAEVADPEPKFVPADEGVKTLTLAKGMEANLFASEAMFPELVNPVQMDVDTKGRIWIAAWQTYPKWQPDREMLDRLLILPDDNADGVADRAITFAYIHNPTGFTFWNGGVVVASAPNLWFLKDTDGDDVADYKEILLTGLSSADTHHTANGFDYGPDGYIYYQRGVFNVSNIETPWQAGQSSSTPGMYRFNPRTHRYSFHADNGPNSHGGDFDYWGYQYATDATSGNAFQVRPTKNGKFRMYKLLEKTVRPVPSSGILSSQHFPPENNQNYIILNSIGFLGIKQYTLENKDGKMWGTETDDLLVSSDGNFRPTDFKVGYDGALYVADWSNAIIGHMQHNVRDPSRDHDHGRVYRITVTGRPLQAPVAIDGQPIEALLEVLKHPTDGVRLRARIELSERNTDEVMAATQKWIQQFDPTKVEDAHPLLEALWLCEQFNVVNEGLLNVVLSSPQPDARRAAERVKYMWELEGQLGHSMAGMDHSAHAAADEEDAPNDYLKQEKSPEPTMDGDTLVVHIQTLKEQMKYDRTAFAVKPGMKVRLIFSNPDAMDHNLMIVQPDTASEVAMAAMMLGQDGPKKGWLPESDKILVASKTLAMGQKDTLEFTAPKKPGVYDYICTYPGHWMLMNGKMHVVRNIDKWIAENAAAPQTASRAFVQEWKVADLTPALAELEKPRETAQGEAVFKAASCIACHQPTANGTQVGPDLAGVGERFDALGVLTELLEPSTKINEKFQSWKLDIETDDAFADSTLIGLIVEEGDDFVRVVTNPLTDTEGVKVLKSKIKEKTAAPLSTMPTGLLNTYSKDEILDLIAFLRANGVAALTAANAGAHQH